jgi:hypothetical protein
VEAEEDPLCQPDGEGLQAEQATTFPSQLTSCIYTWV